MTVLPLQSRLLSVDEFSVLPENPDARYELQGGAVVMSPSPAPEHQICQGEVQGRLKRQVPRGHEVIAAVDIDLGLVPTGKPGFVRIPDLIVVSRAAVARRRAEGGLLRASEVVLAVEIISPSTRRMDTVIKHAEYSDAGIPHYWMIDLELPISLVASHQGGELGYVDAPAVTGTFTTTAPFPVTLRLDTLL